MLTLLDGLPVPWADILPGLVSEPVCVDSGI